MKSDRYAEFNDRIFRVISLHYDAEGDLRAFTAECLTPKGEEFKWWTVHVESEESLQFFTLH